MEVGDDQCLFEKMIALACGCKVTVTRMCHLVNLASLADKYQMDKMVVDAVEGCIVRNLDVDHCCKLLAWAFDGDKDHFPLAKTAVRNMALVRFKELSLSEQFGNLSENVLKAIIQHPKVQADEQMLQQAVMRWCSEQCGPLTTLSMEACSSTFKKPVSERLRVHLLVNEMRDAFVSNDEIEFNSTAFNRNEFACWRMGTNVLPACLPKLWPLQCMSDGLVYTAMKSGEVLVLDAFNLDKVHALNLGALMPAEVSSIAVCGHFLLLGDRNGVVHCYDRLHGEHISRWNVDEKNQEVHRMKPWGQHLLAVGTDGNISIFDLHLPHVFGENSCMKKLSGVVCGQFELWNGRVLFFSHHGSRNGKCVKVYAIGAANDADDESDPEAILHVHSEAILHPMQMVLSMDKLYISPLRQEGEISEWALGTWERQRTFSPWQMLRDLHFEKVLCHDFLMFPFCFLGGSQIIFVGSRPGVPISQPFISWGTHNPTAVKGFIGAFDVATLTFARVVLLPYMLRPKLMVYGDIWA